LSLLLLLLLGMRASSSIVASRLSSNRRRHALRTRGLARDRSLVRRHADILRCSSALLLRSMSLSCRSLSRRARIRLRALSRVRPAQSSSRTRRSVMLRTVVFVAVAAFRPDPCCKAADCYGADCDQGHPVAESALLTGGRRRRVEWASRALSSVVGHADRLPWPHWTRES
jgi:hypothetical protein